MPAPPRMLEPPDAPSPEAFQERLAYLSAAYQQMHAENETLRMQLLAYCARPSETALQYISQRANASHDDELAPTEVEEPSINGDILPTRIRSGPSGAQSWLPSARNLLGKDVRKAKSKVQHRLMDQYFRLANADAGGLTVRDLLVIGVRFNPTIDEHAMISAILQFRDFCNLGPESMQDHRQLRKSHPDFGEAIRSLDVLFPVFERLAGEEELDSHQVLQDDAPILLKLRSALAQEASKHVAAREERWNNMMEMSTAFVILLNVLFLGYQSNRSTLLVDQPWVFAIEVVFTLYFVLEVVVKIWTRGISWFFCGKSWRWNVFDALFSLTSLASVFVVMLQIIRLTEKTWGARYWPLVRLMRIARVARLLRLLRFKFLSELRAMVEGVVSGLHVFFWAIVLLVVFTYVLALVVMVSIAGSRDYHIIEDQEKYIDDQSFGSVFRVMFTVFRCFTDGCSAFDGTPLPLHFSKYYGGSFMTLYALFYLFVTIGIFNLITATYLNNAIDTSNKRRQREREINAGDMERRLRQLLCDLSQRHHPRPRQSFLQALSSWLSAWCCACDRSHSRKRVRHSADLDPTLTVNKQRFDMWLEDEQMLELLDDMDIGTANRADLFHVLDSDMSGSLQLKELLGGLMKLRGPAEKCDVVATLLSVKHLTPMVEDLHSRLLATAGNDLNQRRPKASQNGVHLPANAHYYI